MARTFVRQDTQIRNSDVYDDTIGPSLANFETNPTNIEVDLNNLRSMASHLLDVQAGNWYDVINTPGTFENGAQRGVSNLNTDLHELERKRILRKRLNLTDVTVEAAQNWTVLDDAAGELPGNTTIAVGAVTTLGTVAADNSGGFDAHALVEVSGSSAITPKNLCEIVDASTRDPILSSGRTIYALMQSENASDGFTATTTTPNRVQLSFVRLNATGDDLEACPVADIENAVINYCYIERVALDDLTEEDFLRGAATDTPAAGTSDRQTVYDNQGATPVDVTTNSILDLEGAGLFWEIRDDAEATLFRITEGSAGGTSTILFGTDVDTFDNNAAVNDFLNGASFDTGAAGTTINVGVTPNQIDSGGVLSVASGGGADLNLVAALELNMTDSYRAGSTWSLTDGVALANSSQEWSDFETTFGEVSLLAAITAAGNISPQIEKTYANVTSTTTADTDVGGSGGGANLDAQIHDLTAGDFVTDHDVFLNGQLLRGGADASANNDYYPGTSLALGQLRFEFTVKTNDVLAVISRATV